MAERTRFDRAYPVLVGQSFVSNQELLIFTREDVVGNNSKRNSVPKVPTQRQQECALATSYRTTNSDRKGSLLPISILVAWHVSHGEFAWVLHDFMRMAMLVGCGAIVMAMAMRRSIMGV